MPLAYRQLLAMTDTHRRGRLFEDYIAQLLRAEHVEVAQNVGAADGRQVDLDAVIGDHHYLVEAKWRQGRVGRPAVSGVISRLEGCAPGTVGVLVSAGGFSGSAVEHVRSHPATPVLLISGADIEVAERRRDLRELIERRRHQLLTYRRVELDTGVGQASAAAGNYPEPSRIFLTSDGARTPMLELPGDFGPTAFVLEMPDLDVLPGRSVALEVTVPATSSAELGAIVDQLTVHGWVTRDGAWRIAQQGLTWNGFGIRAMLDALANPKARYRQRQMHHSETFTYIDYALGGTYALTATVARRGFDRVLLATLAFRTSRSPPDPESHQMSAGTRSRSPPATPPTGRSSAHSRPHPGPSTTPPRSRHLE